jgi:hypothetical protein
MKIKIYRLPWWVWGFTKLKNKVIFDLGYLSIWIIWGKK